ncbi:MAG: ABC transporter permease, partial [Bacteroidota bacterium]|nr:ABC transporter permease [Bacteroidota bacterium]
MGFLDVLEIALISLSRNKMRSFLTMLGIIIGVGAVIAMMAVGYGAQQSIKDQIATLGTNVILIFPGSTNQSGVRTGFGTAVSLTSEDIQAIK